MSVNAVQLTKTVADPCAMYLSMHSQWLRNKVVCGGQRFAREYDATLDLRSFDNLLIPFSPTMTAEQYSFYVAESELPGISFQYIRTVIGALLRKQPQLVLPEGTDDEVTNWIMNSFGKDNSSIISFLDQALLEELQTSRAWVHIDYPKVDNELTKEEQQELKPFPTIWKAEDIVNWSVDQDINGNSVLKRIIVRFIEEEFTDKNEFHPEYRDTVYVHELVNGFYQVRKFQNPAPSTRVNVANGRIVPDYGAGTAVVFEEVDINTNIMMHGERLTFIPAWPINGAIDIVDPIITPLIDKEVSLYNKISRRNHLLYGASTYTPIVASNMTNEEFDAIVDAGLGSWLKINQGDAISTLDTPVGALSDMEAAIAANIEEMAKLGVRMLSPETAQSGVALELRNASQSAQLGTLNSKVSKQLSDIIAFMINWRYDTDLKASDVIFKMSSDFNPTPVGVDWLTLVTEWYQQGLIPRSVWLAVGKQNDLIPSDYDDAKSMEEMGKDEFVITPNEQASILQNIQQ
jgi:hypothetical protein